MKKLISAAIVAAIILAACGAAPAGETKTESRFVGQSASDHLQVVEDTETGCRYILYDGYKNGGITPLMLPDGTQSCN